MRIGLTVPTPGENPDLATLLAVMERADGLGLNAVWMPNVSSRGFDAATALALAGGRTRQVELGTFGFRRVDPAELPASLRAAYRRGRLITALVSIFLWRRIRIVPLRRDGPGGLGGTR